MTDDWSNWSAPLPPDDATAARVLASVPRGGSALVECRSLLAAEDLAARLKAQVDPTVAVVRVVEVRELGPWAVPLSFAVRIRRPK